MADCWQIIHGNNYLGNGVICLQHFERYWVIEQICSIGLRCVYDECVIPLKRVIPVGDKLKLARIFINSFEVDVVSATIFFV